MFEVPATIAIQVTWGRAVLPESEQEGSSRLSRGRGRQRRQGHVAGHLEKDEADEANCVDTPEASRLKKFSGHIDFYRLQVCHACVYTYRHVCHYGSSY